MIYGVCSANTETDKTPKAAAHVDIVSSAGKGGTGMALRRPPRRRVCLINNNIPVVGTGKGYTSSAIYGQYKSRHRRCPSIYMSRPTPISRHRLSCRVRAHLPDPHSFTLQRHQPRCVCCPARYCSSPAAPRRADRSPRTAARPSTGRPSPTAASRWGPRSCTTTVSQTEKPRRKKTVGQADLASQSHPLRLQARRVRQEGADWRRRAVPDRRLWHPAAGE